MRRFFLSIALIGMLACPVMAQSLTAPTVPESAQAYMPADPTTLVQGIWEVFRQALVHLRPDFAEASRVCLLISAVTMAMSMLQSFSGTTVHVSDFVAVVMISAALLDASHSLIHLGSTTVQEISEYGKLLLPVMTAATAAQGGMHTSAALYSATALFDAVLSSLISKLLIPLVYFLLVFGIGAAALGEQTLQKIRDMLKSGMIWILKVLLYVFTGYISITGVLSGSTDATTLKMAKLTISGAVPVVGGILSDASEAVLVGAGTVKNAVGLYGMYALLAIWIGPFFKIGVHYLLLKLTGSICGIFASKRIAELIGDFSTCMGMLLAMTGTVCLMLMISMICFMKGVG